MNTVFKASTIRRPARPGIFQLRRALLLALVIAIAGATGCRTSPIRNYDKQPVPSGATQAQVGKAIVSAGNSLGWAMKEEYPGMVSGELFVRDHVAKIKVPYSATDYSIDYVSSQNLKYDAAKRTIHSNYNGWVENLDNGIRTRLARL